MMMPIDTVELQKTLYKIMEENNCSRKESKKILLQMIDNIWGISEWQRYWWEGFYIDLQLETQGKPFGGNHTIVALHKSEKWRGKQNESN